LQGNKLQALSAEKLSAALSTHETLKYLNLENNEIGTNGVIVIFFHNIRASQKAYYSHQTNKKVAHYNN
jgi:Ran GTPase-activating protein (RanGAP) involved in mRNA processing and transport